MNSFGLNELKANRLLASAGISMVQTFLCKSEREALENAEEIGFPIALKILSPDIMHKTEAGCVKVDIRNQSELRYAYRIVLNNAKKFQKDAHIEGVIIQKMLRDGLQLIFGISYEAQFGHTIVFGKGGIYVDVYQDLALRLVPITKKDAYNMIDETQISKILLGKRLHKYNLDEAANVLLNLSKLVKEKPEIKEIDINPYIIYEGGIGGAGVDAVVTISNSPDKL